MDQSKEIRIYLTSTCPHCKRARGFLTENGIGFEEFDVLDNQNAREAMIRISGQMGVPVIVIGDEIVIGFNRDRLKEKLGL